jgi:hypothetical protein
LIRFWVDYLPSAGLRRSKRWLSNIAWEGRDIFG